MANQSKITGPDNSGLAVLNVPKAEQAVITHEVPEFFDLPMTASLCELAAHWFASLIQKSDLPEHQKKELQGISSALQNTSMLMFTTLQLKEAERKHTEGTGAVIGIEWERKSQAASARHYWWHMDNCLTNAGSVGENLRAKCSRYNNPGKEVSND